MEVSKLIESDQVFQELFDNMSSGVAVYEAKNDGEDFIFKDINKAGEVISQVEREAIIDRKVDDIFPSVKDIGLFEVFKKVWRTGKSMKLPTSFYADSRISQWVENYVYKLPSGYIVAIYDDITEHKKSEIALRESEYKYRSLNQELEQKIEERTRELKESEEEFRLIFENAADAIFWAETDTGKIINCNKTARILLEKNEDEIIGQHFSILHPHEKMEPYEKEFKKGLEGGKNRSSEVILISKSGTLIPAIVTGSTTLICGKKINQGIFHDITNRKKMQQKLKKSEEKYRIAYNTTEFYKDIFTHDINNILQNINSSAELSSLYLDTPEKLSEINDICNIISEQVTRGVKLIDNIQKLSQIGESKLVLQKIDVCESLSDAIKFISQSFQNRDVKIKLDSLSQNIHVLADNLVLDVFENILFNGVRHNDKPNIELSIKISKKKIKEKKYIKFEFLDNGIGIEDTRKKSIFQKDSKEKSKKGMGIGLSLVKKIVENYNGKIWIEDKIKGDYTKGSNFIILIPEIKV